MAGARHDRPTTPRAREWERDACGTGRFDLVKGETADVVDCKERLGARSDRGMPAMSWIKPFEGKGSCSPASTPKGW